MDWEMKFSSIVRETENNLEKVKKRLGSARVSSNLALSLNNSGSDSFGDGSFTVDKYPLSVLSANTSAYNGGSYQSPYKSSSLLSGPSGHDTLLSPGGHVGVMPQALESSPGIISLLHDKIEAQAKAIESLTRTVHRLSEERDLYHKQVKTLYDEVDLLKSRVAEKGVDLQTERKLEQWRREMHTEMQMLQHQLNMQRSSGRDDAPSNGFHDNQASSLLREMQDLKRFIQSDCDSLRRDIDTVKNRIVRAESNMGTVLNEVKGIGRQSDLLDKNVRELSSSHLSAHQDLSRSYEDRTQHNTDISELRRSLQGLRDQVNQVQTRAQVMNTHTIHHDNTTYTLNGSSSADYKRQERPVTVKVTETTTARTRQDSDDLLLSTHDSDLDLSDLADLQSTDFSLSARDPQMKPTDTDDELDLCDTADLNLTSDDLSTDGDTLDLDELK